MGCCPRAGVSSVRLMLDAGRVAVVSRFFVVDASLQFGLFEVFLFYLLCLSGEMSQITDLLSEREPPGSWADD